MDLTTDYVPTFTPELKKTFHVPFESGTIKAYLIDFRSTTRWSNNEGTKIPYAGLQLYVNTDEENVRRLSFFVQYDPYFFVIPKKGKGKELLDFLSTIKNIPNTYGIKDVKLISRHVFDYDIYPFIKKVKLFQIVLRHPKDVPTYVKAIIKNENVFDCREYKVPFDERVSTDLKLFCFKLYEFKVSEELLKKFTEIETQFLPKLDLYTFDIEIRKKPVKKPQNSDPVDAMGFKFRDTGFMLNNVELTYFSFPDFYLGVDSQNRVTKMTEEEFNKKGQKYKPVFYKVINCKNEEELLKKFIGMYLAFKPMATNGYASDFFDFPHLTARGKLYGIDLEKYFDRDNFEGEGTRREGNFVGDFKRAGCLMFDTLDWVRRDSYLPKGFKGLKSASRELMNIEAKEIDHEEQVRLWEKIKTKWLNPNDPENSDLVKFEENKRKSYEEAYKFLVYCASDVYVTDIFASQSVLGFNQAVCTMIGMNYDKVSRGTRGPMVEANLLRQTQGKMVSPSKVMKKRKEYINPLKMKKEGRKVFKEVRKSIKEEDVKYWAECLTSDEMRKHCEKCSNRECSENWRNNWSKSINTQNPILCERDSDLNDIEKRVYYYPLNDMEFLVTSEKYEGALVICFNPGVFKDNSDLNFIIVPEKLEEIKKLFKESLTRLINAFESKPKKIKGIDNPKNVRIIDKEKLFELIDNRIGEITSKLELKDGKYYWKGTPVLIHVDVASMYPNIIINFNLQPNGTIDPKICEECPQKSKGDEKQCWVDLKWNAIYDVITLSKADNKKAEDEIQSFIDEGREMDDEFIENIYKKYATGNKKYETLKIPMISRFCQKAPKLFVNTVRNLRDERYKYKYAMSDLEDEIDKKSAEFKENDYYKTLNDIAKAVDESRKDFVEKNKKKFLNKEAPEVLKVTLSELIDASEKGLKAPESVQKRMEILKKKYGSRDIPIDVQIEIDQLSIKRVFARNMQLGLKVLLNSFYGYVKSVGARFWSIDVAGATCYTGQDIINFAIGFCDPIAINIEVDSLDYGERIILKDPQGLIDISSIGEFVDRQFVKYGIENRDVIKNVDYADITDGWKVLSATQEGLAEWQSIKQVIRQKTDRDVYNVKTPFGSVKVTESHSIFHNSVDKIQHIAVKDITNEHITHISYIPPVEMQIDVNLAKPNPYIPINVYVDASINDNIKYNLYKKVRLRLQPYANCRKIYYEIPVNEYYGTLSPNVLVGSSRSFKFPSVIPMTEELAEFCGWYVSEGWSTFRLRGNKHDAEVNIAQKDQINLQRIYDLARKIGQYINNYEPKKILSDKRSDTYRIGMSNLFFYHLMNVLGCGSDSFTKRIPKIILSSPKNIKESFLRGYWLGDGNATGKRITFDTSSDGLRDDLFVIGKQLGHIVSMLEYDASTSGSRMYRISFMDYDNWIRGSRSHYDHEDIGQTIGLKCNEITQSVKSSPYVYDLSVEKNNNFVSAHGGILCHNTDGLWTAIPSLIPLEVSFDYQIKDDPNSKVYSDKFNLFNETLNSLVKQRFTNNFNYVPCDPDGKIRPNFDYENDDQWINDPHWNNSSQCMIKFDYDGPFSTVFVYTKKRMKIYKRDSKDPNIQKVEDITGLDELRKGELGLIRKCSTEITNAYRDGTSIEDSYIKACEVVNKYLKQLRDGTLDLDLILESRDLSDKTAPKICKAYQDYQSFLKKYEIDPMEFPVFSDSVEEKCKSKPMWDDIWFGRKEGRKKLVSGIFDSITRNHYSMTGFRTIDLGIPIEIGDTVEWIVTKYPRIKKKSKKGGFDLVPVAKSQRSIPSRLFDGTEDEIKMYLKKWFGEDFSKFSIKDFVDWEFYTEKFEAMIDRYLIIPAQSQGFDPYKWLKLESPKKKSEEKKKGTPLDFFMHPMSALEVKNQPKKEPIKENIEEDKGDNEEDEERDKEGDGDD